MSEIWMFIATLIVGGMWMVVGVYAIGGAEYLVDHAGGRLFGMTRDEIDQAREWREGNGS